MRSIAAEVSKTFTRKWISRYGVTDQGTQFEPDLFNRLMIQIATKRRTTSYHGCAKGMIERLPRAPSRAAPPAPP